MTYFLKKKGSHLRRQSDSPVAKIKRRIQATLREICIIRDKTCVYGRHPEASPCDPSVLQCDHLESRARTSTYADPDACVLVCKKHHGWKSFYAGNKEIYDRRIREVIGEERWNRIQEKGRQIVQRVESDWLKAEKELVDQLEAAYKNR